MHLLRRAVLVAAIALLGNMDAASAAMDVKMSNTMPSNPSLRANALTESANQDITKRSLRQKNKALNDDDHASNEERGWIQNFLGYKLNLKTISDEGLAAIMQSEKAKKKAFKYLDGRKVNAQMAYARLGVDKAPSGGTREKFWNAYGNWLQSKYPDSAR